MADDIAKLPRHESSDKDHYANEINAIFSKHLETLDDKRQAIIDKIDKWCSDCTEQINNHANQQKCLLNDAYIRHRRVFDKKYNENLETANAYQIAKQEDLFNELRDACRLLKFKVAKLTFSKHEMEYPEVIIQEEPMERTNPQETTITKRNDARRRRRTNKNSGNTTENNNSATASSSSDLITANSEQTRYIYILKYFFLMMLSICIFSARQSSKTTSKIKISPLIDNKDDSYNKCPICFMIFPISMTHNGRYQHINAHMEDD